MSNEINKHIVLKFELIDKIDLTSPALQKRERLEEIFVLAPVVRTDLAPAVLKMQKLLLKN